MPSNRRIKFKSKKRFKKRWDRVVDGLGRRIDLYLPPFTVECPACFFDKVNRVSSGVSKVGPLDPRFFASGVCPTCNGTGVLTTIRKRCIEGIVVWNPGGDKMNEFTFTEAGHEGARQVEIKTDPCHRDLILEATHAIIDDVTCKLSNPPIMRGIGEQHILIAQFFAETK